MTCESFEEWLSDVVRERAEPAVRDEVLGHASACEHCGARLEEERRLGRALRALAEDDAHAEAPARVEAALRAAVRARAATGDVLPGLAARRSRTAWLSAAAALAALALGTWFWRSEPRWGSAPEAGSRIAATPAASEPAAPPRAEVAAPPARSTSAAAVARDRWPAARRRPAAEPESRAVFVPLLSGDPLTDLERGHVERVGLSPVTLASYGWPLEGDVVGEAIQADVLVGEDGVPRAIRVVR